jgi:hypothetical protein
MMFNPSQVPTIASAETNQRMIETPPSAAPTTSIKVIHQPHSMASFPIQRRKLCFPIEVMSRIAEYYVSIFDGTSPQTNAISIMNELLGNPFQPRKDPNEPPIMKQSSTTIAAALVNSVDLQFLVPPDVAPPVPNNLSFHPNHGDRIVPIINKLSRVARPNYSPLQQYQLLHLGTNHMSQGVLLEMIKNKTLTDLPTAVPQHLNKYNCDCWICHLAKPRKLHRGPLTDKTNLPPFTRLHLDFAFFGVESIRGFHSALTLVCGSTSYPFSIPTRSRAPPIDIFRYIIRCLRSLGWNVVFIRVDRDGALANSAEFCKVVIDENCRRK